MSIRRFAAFALGLSILFAGTTMPAVARSSHQLFVYDLYRSGVFSTQAGSDWCVAAGSQMMFNFILHQSDHSQAAQRDYYAYGRSHRGYAFNEPGLDPAAQVAILQHWGGSSTRTYHYVSASSPADAIRIAVSRMRATGKPVSLYVGHAGNHDWIMTGFETTADPAKTASFTVLGVWVLGPYWPIQRYYRGVFDSPPHSFFSASQMNWILGPYSDVMGETVWTGRYLIVAP